MGPEGGSFQAAAQEWWGGGSGGQGVGALWLGLQGVQGHHHAAGSMPTAAPSTAALGCAGTVERGGGGRSVGLQQNRCHGGTCGTRIAR